MDINQKIGQMLLFGFRGLNIQQCQDIAEYISNGRIGGVILFDRDLASGSDYRNIESHQQVKKLNFELQSIAAIPLFIGIDQEGGKVQRLNPSKGFESVPSAAEIGQFNDSEFTAKTYSKLANDLNNLGFNMNFAPVADINLNPKNQIIGQKGRSYSVFPEDTVHHCSIFINELREKNIISVIKHFPGHGSSTADSHLGFVDVTNVWQSQELTPFRMLNQYGYAEAIMTAHIFNSNFDSIYPATLSKTWLTDILKSDLNYDGVIISDDMQMKAISSQYTDSEAIELAINAGVDILIYGNNLEYDADLPKKTTDTILKLLEQGKITEERIDSSYNKIINLKQKYLNH